MKKRVNLMKVLAVMAPLCFSNFVNASGVFDDVTSMSLAPKQEVAKENTSAKSELQKLIKQEEDQRKRENDLQEELAKEERKREAELEAQANVEMKEFMDEQTRSIAVDTDQILEEQRLALVDNIKAEQQEQIAAAIEAEKNSLEKQAEVTETEIIADENEIETEQLSVPEVAEAILIEEDAQKIQIEEEVAISEEEVAVSEEEVAVSEEEVAVSEEEVTASEEEVAVSEEEVTASEEEVESTEELEVALEATEEEELTEIEKLQAIIAKQNKELCELKKDDSSPKSQVESTEVAMLLEKMTEMMEQQNKMISVLTQALTGMINNNNQPQTPAISMMPSYTSGGGLIYRDPIHGMNMSSMTDRISANPAENGLTVFNINGDYNNGRSTRLPSEYQPLHSTSAASDAPFEFNFNGLSNEGRDLYSMDSQNTSEFNQQVADERRSRIQAEVARRDQLMRRQLAVDENTSPASEEAATTTRNMIN